MPRTGTGSYVLPAGNPVTPSTLISSTWANSTLADIGNALTQSLSKDGQTTPTANLPMGGFHHTGASPATQQADYAQALQAQTTSLQTLVTLVSSTSAVYDTELPLGTLPADLENVDLFFIPNVPNSAFAEITINGINAGLIYGLDGGSLPANALVPNQTYRLFINDGRVYADSILGSQFVLKTGDTMTGALDIRPPTGTATLSLAAPSAGSQIGIGIAPRTTALGDKFNLDVYPADSGEEAYVMVQGSSGTGMVFQANPTTAIMNVGTFDAGGNLNLAATSPPFAIATTFGGASNNAFLFYANGHFILAGQQAALGINIAPRSPPGVGPYQLDIKTDAGVTAYAMLHCFSGPGLRIEAAPTGIYLRPSVYSLDGSVVTPNNSPGFYISTVYNGSGADTFAFGPEGKLSLVGQIPAVGVGCYARGDQGGHYHLDIFKSANPLATDRAVAVLQSGTGATLRLMADPAAGARIDSVVMDAAGEVVLGNDSAPLIFRGVQGGAYVELGRLDNTGRLFLFNSPILRQFPIVLSGAPTENVTVTTCSSFIVDVSIIVSGVDFAMYGMVEGQAVEFFVYGATGKIVTFSAPGYLLAWPGGLPNDTSPSPPNPPWTDAPNGPLGLRKYRFTRYGAIITAEWWIY